uniref:Uncharacterized protein n=1 Tax=Populus trichocarpa TaxID=3694 RepID=A0A2K1R6P1_POPTR
MEYQKAEMLPFSYDTIISYTILLHMHNQAFSEEHSASIDHISKVLDTYLSCVQRSSVSTVGLTCQMQRNELNFDTHTQIKGIHIQR